MYYLFLNPIMKNDTNDLHMVKIEAIFRCKIDKYTNNCFFNCSIDTYINYKLY